LKVFQDRRGVPLNLPRSAWHNERFTRRFLSSKLLQSGRKTLVTREKWSLIRHRFRPFTAGAWHLDPLRVFARPRGAWASRSACMGLSAAFIVSASIGIKAELTRMEMALWPVAATLAQRH
tara:strand:- start:1205 stop:1567 length:363 start_codon:yes stop_codon:yes gene_type:complete